MYLKREFSVAEKSSGKSKPAYRRLAVWENPAVKAGAKGRIFYRQGVGLVKKPNGRPILQTGAPAALKQAKAVKAFGAFEPCRRALLSNKP